jgi:hypothetical protein
VVHCLLKYLRPEESDGFAVVLIESRNVRAQ